MNKFELTTEEKSLLNAIANDKFSIGAFSGMIFNALIDTDQTDEHIDMRLKLALRIRLRILHHSDEYQKSLSNKVFP